jgi:hypothetical protein
MAGVYLSEAPSPPMFPYPPPPFTLYNCTLYMYTAYLFRQGSGGGGAGELTREKVRGGNSAQSWVENTNMRLTVSPVYKL